MPKETETHISERAQQLLKLLIEHYIKGGQPVASKTLSQETGIIISPATIRNIMASLEENGFLHSPHTSAGRVPTEKAYRLFVDSLMTVKPLSNPEIETLKSQINQQTESKNIISSASTLLSRITKLAGVITIPKQNRSILRHIEFLPLSKKQVLAILVLNNKLEVQNRIINTARPYTSSELQQVANFLTAKFSGQDLDVIRQNLLSEMHQDRNNMEKIAQAIIDVANKAFTANNNDDDDCVVAGEANLLDMLDETGVDKLRRLFEAFNRKKDILYILDKCLTADDVQIYIGEESGQNIFQDCSLVTKSYKIEGKIVGVMGVIGPTRMDYTQVVSAVDITAKLLSAALAPNSY